MSEAAKSEAMAKLMAKLDVIQAGQAKLLTGFESMLEALAKMPRQSILNPGASGGAVFPGYGNSKGQPIAGADLRTLEFYANGARRSLGDPSKARFHGKEQALLSAIEAEIARQSGGAPDDGPPGDVPPPPF